MDQPHPTPAQATRKGLLVDKANVALLTALVQLGQFHPAASDWLRDSAFLSPRRIPFELAEAASLPEASDPPAGRAGRGTWAVLGPLARFGLIRLNLPERTFSVHSLTQQVVRESMLPAGQQQHVVRMLGVVARIFPGRGLDHRLQCGRLLPHALALLRWSRVLSIEPEASRALRHTAGACLVAYGLESEARALGYGWSSEDLSPGC
jgi:hypothetical protein